MGADGDRSLHHCDIDQLLLQRESHERIVRGRPGVVAARVFRRRVLRRRSLAPIHLRPLSEDEGREPRTANGPAQMRGPGAEHSFRRPHRATARPRTIAAVTTTMTMRLYDHVVLLGPC